MTADDITSSYAHKKNNTKTIFLYYSTTTNILKNIKQPEVSHCHDYTYMDYDIVISSKVSNEWLSTLQNNIKEYIDLGPISSDLIIKVSNNKALSFQVDSIVNNASAQILPFSMLTFHSHMNLTLDKSHKTMQEGSASE